MRKLFTLLIVLMLAITNGIAQEDSASYIVTHSDQKIAIEPGYPILHNRAMTEVYCRNPFSKVKLNGNKIYFTTKTEAIKKIVDGDRNYTPIELEVKLRKKKKKKSNSKKGIVLARTIAKKDNNTLFVFKFTDGSNGYYTPNDRYVIMNENNEVIEREGIMNNYLLKPEERNLVVDENAKILHQYFGECLGRSHLELFDFIVLKERIITQDVFEDAIPLLLWKNNNVICN